MDEVNNLLETLLKTLNSKVVIIEELKLKKNGSIVVKLPNGLVLTVKNIPQLNEGTINLISAMIKNVIPPIFQK